MKAAEGEREQEREEKADKGERERGTYSHFSLQRPVISEPAYHDKWNGRGSDKTYHCV